MLSTRLVILLFPFPLLIGAAVSIGQTATAPSPTSADSTFGNVVWQYDTKG
jgi:hypothetical protein